MAGKRETGGGLWPWLLAVRSDAIYGSSATDHTHVVFPAFSLAQTTWTVQTPTHSAAAHCAHMNTSLLVATTAYEQLPPWPWPASVPMHR